MTDEELMLAVCIGEKSAYQTLVKQHLKPISHYAYHMLGSQKDTEDITQEVFLKLWINASSWKKEEAKLTTWLHRITHNICIDYLRKQKRVQTQNTFSEESVDAITGKQNDGDNENQLSLLQKAISNLPESQRSALTLCHYQGFSNKEAAVIMNISVKALESVISRAKRTLRSQLTASKEAPARKPEQEQESK